MKWGTGGESRTSLFTVYFLKKGKRSFSVTEDFSESRSGQQVEIKKMM
jgi:hypothetical protein